MRCVAIALLLLTTADREGADLRLERGLASILEHQTEAIPGWPWMTEASRPAPNLGGVVAVTLLRAYDQRPDPATWVTLVQYAHSLRDFYAAESVLPYKADIEFLAALGASGLDDSAMSYAMQLFGRVRRVSPTGTDEYERIAAGRAQVPEVIGYDIALSIRAALAVGQREYAEELADAAIDAGKLSLRDPHDSYELTSLGALLHAVSLLTWGQNASELQAAATALVSAQSDAGSWAGNNTQATAYAVMALKSVGVERPAERGRAWLLARQLRAGGWAAYHDGLPEPFVGPVVPLAEAEAYAALLASR